uniref:Uncharacterized protein n=1 Tax=viral metagenome TaxID=1070528 RepID=A0A6M3IR23_9ZZZZ
MNELSQIRIIDKWYGMRTRELASQIPDFYLANALNVSFSDVGGVVPYKQYSQFANQLTGVGRIISSFTLYTSLGVEIPVRVRDDDTYTHLEWYNSVAGAWETLLPNLTTAKPMAYADYNTATQDGVFMCNGVMNYSFWKKAIGSVASNTATVITLNETASTQGFASGGGTVIVDGTEYTYTGTSGKTLTGLSGLPTFDANEGVAEAVDDATYSSITKFDILAVGDGRVWGARTDNVRLYYSQVGVGSNFTSSTNPDDPGFRDFIEGEGSITAIRFIKENAIVFKKDLVRLYKLEYPTSATRVSVSKTLKRGDSSGAICQQGTIEIGEAIYFTTARGGLKSISLNSQLDGFDFEDVTDNIRPTLSDSVFTSARMIYYEKEKILLVAFKKDSDSSQNDRVIAVEFVKDINDQWHKSLGLMDWTVGDWFIYGGNLYFGASYEPNCFKAFDGYQKGAADTPYTALFTTKRYKFSNSPVQQKDIPYLVVTGWTLSGVLNFQLQYNYLGSMASLEATFDPVEDTDYIIQPGVNMLGAFEMGSEPVGGTLTEIDELNYFQIFFTLPSNHHPQDVQLTIFSDTSGARWKLESLNWEVTDAKLAIPPKLKKTFKKST